ncbi:hypothetical protein ACHAWO_000472 [Cyclotella atomus]|uniref:Uncharacterized protein n=1 Tax=Cyclotella atomus TaxID=382360 RepID=A0ABD3NE67_9STRA
MMGCAYVEGRYGVARDHFMATQLFHRAANLGSHQAAIGGNVFSRYAVGNQENDKGNSKRALQHWMIAARGGHEESWDKVQMTGMLFPHLVSKEDMDKTGRGYIQYCEEVKSD